MTTIQGRTISFNEINFIKTLLDKNSSWSRRQLSQELCKIWNWRNSTGQIKDISCRSLLRKLEQRGYIKLPPPLRYGNNHLRNKTIKFIPHETFLISCSLPSIMPLAIQRIKDDRCGDLFNCLLHRYHYLSYKGTVGENMKYIIFDCNSNILACLLFGAPAWRVEHRDTFIGWNDHSRRQNLQFITNNSRFLILPWIRVPYLASHILSKIAKIISADWMEKYAHPLYLMETFVEVDRFKGTCYKAANWIYVGRTKGRTRNDRYSKINAPIKDTYLYPLSKIFRKELTHD